VWFVLFLVMLFEYLLGLVNGSLGMVCEVLCFVGLFSGVGLFVVFGGYVVVVLDVVMFFVLVVVLVLMWVSESDLVRGFCEYYVLYEVMFGARYLWCLFLLRVMVVVIVILLFAIGMGESVFFVVVDEGLGWLVVFFGVLVVV